eukprot:5826878-Pleurochrysis_carterae.AAC.1
MAAWRALKRAVGEAPVLASSCPTCPSRGRRGRVACVLRVKNGKLCMQAMKRNECGGDCDNRTAHEVKR